MSHETSCPALWNDKDECTCKSSKFNKPESNTHKKFQKTKKPVQNDSSLLDELKKLRQENANLKRENNGLKQENYDLKKENDNICQENLRFATDIDQMEREIDQLQNELKIATPQLDKTIVALSKENTELKQSIKNFMDKEKYSGAEYESLMKTCKKMDQEKFDMKKLVDKVQKENTDLRKTLEFLEIERKKSSSNQDTFEQQFTKLCNAIYGSGNELNKISDLKSILNVMTNELASMELAFSTDY